jgi:hypothetical protein
MALQIRERLTRMFDVFFKKWMITSQKSRKQTGSCPDIFLDELLLISREI